jgi:hypothetical protein
MEAKSNAQLPEQDGPRKSKNQIESYEIDLPVFEEA